MTAAMSRHDELLEKTIAVHQGFVSPGWATGWPLHSPLAVTSGRRGS